jgi:hypothetical protein
VAGTVAAFAEGLRRRLTILPKAIGPWLNPTDLALERPTNEPPSILHLAANLNKQI